LGFSSERNPVILTWTSQNQKGTDLLYDMN
jgi:hypothetical protein